MELIRILFCGKKDGAINTISVFINTMQSSLDINILKRTGVSLANFIQEEVDEEDEECFEPFKVTIDFTYKDKDCKMEIERITKAGERFMQVEIQYLSEDDLLYFNDSIWYEIKEKLIIMLHKNYNQIIWLADSQNNKISTQLYSKLHQLENYLREVINRYMTIKHGGNWFEAYSYEDYKNKYLKFSEWFNKSRYNLFKMVDDHLYNLEIDDIFDALKAAKKKQMPRAVKKALEDIKEHEKDKATEIANIELLDNPSLWEEERFDEVFERNTIERWRTDLSKRRNMVAHNKMICRDMYNDTVSEIALFFKKFQKAEELLKSRLKSEETLSAERMQRDSEIILNLEYCEINPVLPEDQDIIENLNETDDFMELSGIICDKISCIGNEIDDLLSLLDDVQSSLYEYNFFDDGKLVGKELLEQYIEFAHNHHQYSTWKILLEKEISIEIYKLIEPGIVESMTELEERLKKIKDSIFFVDLDCFSEGKLVRIEDFDENCYTLELRGWFCPDRGNSDTIHMEWSCNGEIIEYGEIYISYGDYEMTEDGIPLPCVEDCLSVHFNKINSELDKVIDEIIYKMSLFENQLLQIEI